MKPCRRVLFLMVCALQFAQVVLAQADVPGLIERCKPSIVLVGTYSPTDNPRFGFRGSGFVVEDGNLAVTNAHVLPNPDVTESELQMMVQVRRGVNEWSLRVAKVVAIDRPRDLALLRFEGAAAPALKLAADDVAREGRSFLLMGFPIGGALGFSTVTHRGMISAVTSMALPSANARSLDPRALRQLREGSFDILQLDATAYPGNSGGPIIDVNTGEVLGVVSMVLTKGTHESAIASPTGISYAIPVQHVTRLVGNSEGR